MVTINVAYTAPVNSASAPSKLTPSQLWTALERKSRHGQDFVPAIASTEVIEELSSTRLKRKVVFKPLDGMPGSVVEDVTAYKPSRVEFRQDTGTVVNNIISEAGTEGDFFLTYTFEWVYPELSEGTAEFQKLLESHRKMAKVAVEETIDVARKMAAHGELGS